MNERYTFAFFPLKRPSMIPVAPLEWVSQVTQGPRNKFQMTGANYYLMTQMLSKTVQFSFFPESYWKIDGCNWDFLKIDGCNCTRCTRPPNSYQTVLYVLVGCFSELAGSVGVCNSGKRAPNP